MTQEEMNKMLEALTTEALSSERNDDDFLAKVNDMKTHIDSLYSEKTKLEDHIITQDTQINALRKTKIDEIFKSKGNSEDVTQETISNPDVEETVEESVAIFKEGVIE